MCRECHGYAMCPQRKSIRVEQSPIIDPGVTASENPMIEPDTENHTPASRKINKTKEKRVQGVTMGADVGDNIRRRRVERKQVLFKPRVVPAVKYVESVIACRMDHVGPTSLSLHTTSTLHQFYCFS